MKARAVVFQGPGRSLEVREFPVEPPGPDHALVELEAAGICGTDLHIQSGAIPVALPRLILGHESIGTVAQLGSGEARDAVGNPLSKGERVLLVVAEPCRRCCYCLRGDFAACQEMGVTYFRDPELAPHLFGGFAEFIHHPLASLVKVPPEIPLLAIAAFACAGPTLLQSLEYGGGIKPGERVLVQGSGPLGLFATLYAHYYGAKVIFFGSSSNPKRLELAKGYGAEQVLDIKSTTPQERAETLAAWSEDEGVSLAIETSGAPQAFAEGLSLLTTGGRYLVPGQYSQGGGVSIQTELITYKALRIFGSGQYAIRHVLAYFEFLKEKGVAALAREAVTHQIPLQKAEEAFALAKTGEGIKILLVP